MATQVLSVAPHDAQVPLALTSSLPCPASQPKHLHFDQFSVTEGEGKKKKESVFLLQGPFLPSGSMRSTSFDISRSSVTAQEQ